MKQLILFSLSIFCSLFLNAQNPLIKQWDARFGGNGTDVLSCFKQTKDGGYILGGFSYCGMGGDKSQANWGSDDYWIVKIDAIGNKQWDKDFGGVNDDVLFSLQQTSDGGYILGGSSSSGIGGDKTQPTWGGTGDYDYWIVKVDSNGTKQWDKDYGGTGIDYFHSLQQTTDGGFILGGYTGSGISGDKTQATKGIYDYWIIKIDSNGTKQWDQDFGGIGFDYFATLQQTTDGGYILGGSSASGIGGDKTQMSWGGHDYWIVKIDSVGIKQWDKDFGGSDDDNLFSLQQTTDGGYILGGSSYSGIGGDKTGASWGMNDFWIIKIDANGNKQWDKDFGGNNIESDFGSVIQTTDGGYFLCCESFSPISGDKTESNLGSIQAWVVKSDSMGSKEWDKTIFTSPELKLEPYALQTKEGCYAIAEASFGSVAGYKSQANRDNTNGSQDYWIILFCDSTMSPVSSFASSNNICPGSCINFTNLSVNASSYQWIFSGASVTISTDANPQNICYANSGSYDVQLIASNANGTDTLVVSNYITVYPTPPPQSITQSGDTLFAIAGATGYQWYFNANVITGATNYFYVAPASGDYNVVATDLNGCEVEAAIFNVVSNVSSIHSEGLYITLSPALSSEKLMIISEKLIFQVSIFDILGTRLFSGAINDHKSEINIRPYSNGLYFIQLQTESGNISKKFIKD